MVIEGELIESSAIQYKSGDGSSIGAFYSRLSAPGLYSGVIVTMEGMGLMDHHKDIARRFAAQGYLAIAHDLYTREGSPDPSSQEEVLKTLFSAPDSQAMDDRSVQVVHPKSQTHSNGRVGIIGFCSGGRYTLIMACYSSNITPPWTRQAETSFMR